MQGVATLPGRARARAVDVLCLASIECVQNAAEKRSRNEEKDMTEVLKSISQWDSRQPGIIFYIAHRPHGAVAGGDCSIAAIRYSKGVLPRESTLALE
jgi:hypothetical protein